MNKLNILAVLALASTGALAGNVVDNLRTDIMYGDAPLSVSPRSPFVQTGLVNSQLANDLIYGSDSRDHSHKSQPVERIVIERQDISTDIIYGGRSQLNVKSRSRTSPYFAAVPPLKITKVPSESPTGRSRR